MENRRAMGYGFVPANTAVFGVGGRRAVLGPQQSRRKGLTTCAKLKPARFVKGLFRVDKERDPKIVGIALPALATLMVEPLLSSVDIAFIGRLGVLQLGGVGVATTVVRAAFALFNFLAASATPLVASNKKNASPIIVESVYVAAMLGTFVMLVLLGIAPLACSSMAGAESAGVTPFAIVYARWRALASPALFSTFVLSGALRGLQDTVTPLWCAMIANGVNVILDYVTITFLHMGVAGVAIATTVSQILNMSLLFGTMVARNIIKREDLARLPSAKSVKEVAFGAVLSVRTVSIFATFTMSSRLAAARGAVTIASYELARQVWVFGAYVLDSLAVAAQSLVSGFLAENRLVQARRYCSRLLQMSLWAGTLLFMLVWTTAPNIPSLFVPDLETQQMATQFLRSFAPMLPLNALVFVYDGIFIAAKDFGYTAQSIFLAGVGSWIALLYAAQCPATDINSMWLGINVLMVGRALALGSRYLSRRGPIPPSLREDDDEEEEEEDNLNDREKAIQGTQ